MNLEFLGKPIRSGHKKSVQCRVVSRIRSIELLENREMFSMSPMQSNNIGDANGDGRFDWWDLTQVFQIGEYEDSIRGNSIFEEGEWNGDGDFDSGDLVLAFQGGRFVDASDWRSDWLNLAQQAGEYEDGIANNSIFEEGDWNGDGDFDSHDMVMAFQADHVDDRRFDWLGLDELFQAGKNEDSIRDNSILEEGDWNGDGDFDSGDLVLAFQKSDFGDVNIDRQFELALQARRTQRGNLDAELLPPGGSAEIDMLPGRLTKLPVSWFEQRSIGVTGAHRMIFRTTGCTGTADTGLVVTWAETDNFGPAPRAVPNVTYYTTFDNNGNNGSGNGRCSLIDTGTHTKGVTYTVYVFSMTRATSRASLQYSIGGAWTTLSTDDYGGTLVRVGALQNGDFLQVRTASDGTGNDGTQMLLFEPPAPGTTRVSKAAVFNAQGSNTDRDPHIVVDGSWSSPFNAVLLGKDIRGTTSVNTLLKDVETRVDLVRGPLDITYADPSLSCAGLSCTGTQVLLPRGRYYASLFAITPNPLGSGAANYADAIGTDGEGNCPHRARGRGNDLAFTAVLKKNGVILQQRAIPRGLLGEDASLGSFNRIVFEIDADGTSRFSLDVTNKAADVTFFGGWRYVRNQDVNELKVATWNFGEWVFDGNTAARVSILQNAADLLGTRGDLHPGSRRIIEPANQAPWQWEADVIAFQEFYGDTYTHVRDRLQSRTAFGWSWVNANTEIFRELHGGEEVFYGPVFVNDFVRPVEGIKFSNRQLAHGNATGRCDSRWEGSSFDYACPLGLVEAGGILGVNVAYNRAVPAKLRAPRNLGANAGTDRPVAFFNWHLYHKTSAFDKRAENVENLIKSIKYLMAQPADGAFPAGACAFNKECSNTPKYYANRMIIVGDSNMKNHQCGEFAWTLRRLREEFGYAIDVSAATTDSTNRTNHRSAYVAVG
jgi:hypothetical protein